MTTDTVTILMATYNGAKYLPELLDSLLEQTFHDWELIVRDDCSDDHTPFILNDYAQKDDRITVYYGDNRLGSTGNFAWLVRKANNSNYIFFCDQDDVWLPDKIATSLEVIKKQEREFGKDSCQLVFGEKILVDKDLNRLGEAQITNSSKQGFSLWQLLIRNPVYGCTMVINRYLADVAGNIPDYVQTHDYYYSLQAALNGMITKINQPLLLYRQHGDNVTGGINNYGIASKIKSLSSVNKKLHKTIYQNYSFCKEHERSDNQYIKKYIELIESSPFRRVKLAKQDNYYIGGKASTGRLLWALLTYRLEAQV